MKTVLNRTENQDFNTRLGITSFKVENIERMRRTCHNAKLRNIYFRLIHNDFFTHDKMKRYRMTETDSCPRCGIKENLKHLIWECTHSKNIWKFFNEIMKEVDRHNSGSVESYEAIFEVSNAPSINMIKLKIIQELIQIERPKNWNKNNVIEVIKQLINLEKYNAIKYNNKIKFDNKWKKFENLRCII